MMSLALLLALQAACLAGGAMLARRLRHRDSALTLRTAGKRLPALYPVALASAGVFIACFAVWFIDSIEQNLPYIAQRHSKLLPLAAGAALFGGGGGFLLALSRAEGLPRRERHRSYVELGNVLLALMIAGHVMPVAPFLGEMEQDGVVLQSSGFSCGAACVANAARILGTDLTEKTAAGMMGTAISGTSFGQMRYALDQLGIAHRTLNGRLSIDQVALPAILAVDHPAAGSERHVSLLAGRTPDGYEIWDPLKGREIWTPERIAAEWHGNGIECN